MRAITGSGSTEPGVPPRIDAAETAHHRYRPGPRTLVDGRVEAELRQIERRRLQRKRHVDVGAALID
jgi:hypothetical protein